MVKESNKVLFIGGLSIDINEKDLISYFNTFTKVLKVVLLRDQHTGKPKGYAFVTLKDVDTANRLAQAKHYICGRRVECQLAARKNEKEINVAERSRRKIFVTNVPQYVHGSVFEQFFTQFGAVHNCYTIRKSSNQFKKSFGFVEFEDVAVVEALLSQKTPIYLGESKLIIQPFKAMRGDQKADDNSDTQQQSYSHQFNNHLDNTASFQSSSSNNKVCSRNLPNIVDTSNPHTHTHHNTHYRMQAKLGQPTNDQFNHGHSNVYFHLNPTSKYNKISSGQPSRIALYNYDHTTYNSQTVCHTRCNNCSGGIKYVYGDGDGYGEFSMGQRNCRCSMAESLQSYMNLKDITKCPIGHSSEVDHLLDVKVEKCAAKGKLFMLF